MQGEMCFQLALPRVGSLCRLCPHCGDDAGSTVLRFALSSPKPMLSLNGPLTIVTLYNGDSTTLGVGPVPLHSRHDGPLAFDLGHHRIRVDFLPNLDPAMAALFSETNRSIDAGTLLQYYGWWGATGRANLGTETSARHSRCGNSSKTSPLILVFPPI